MSKWISILLIACCAQHSVVAQQDKLQPDHTANVDPFIGTGGHGHTFPGATMPFGMVQLSPDTRLEGWDGCSGYHFTDDVVYGFSHTHLSGTGVADYCDILLKPCIGPVQFDNGYEASPKEGYASRFSKETEQAEPGYYSMELEEGITVELTTTERAGFHRYTFKEAENAHVILDLTHRDQLLDAHWKIVNDSTIQGFRRSKSWAEDQHVYFYAVFSQPIIKSDFRSATILKSTGETSEVFAKGSYQFNLKNGEELLVKVGISFVDIEGAKKNLKAEIKGWDFDGIRAQAHLAWKNELGSIEAYGPAAEDDLHIFYSALYHTMVAPNLFSDVDGRYRKTLPKDEGERSAQHPIGQLSKDEAQYTIFSLWDTYRGTHPLYTIFQQKRTNAFINTFLRQYEDGGQLPVWELACNYTGCMIGYHSIPVIADAYVKGIRDYDAKLALEAMRHSAEMEHLGLPAYQQHGFIPTGTEPESVSKTLEYAYDDWCIAVMARELEDAPTFTEFIHRAQFYKNLFNPENGFLMGRTNGGWFSPFRPEEVNFNYTEANGWQYSLAAPHDIKGLTALMGGDEAMIEHLDELFSADSETSGREQVDITGLIGQYAHGNEPSHHMAYLYNYVGQPWKTQAMTQRIMSDLYQHAPDGLSGNEDCGQMSAWYVLSAMGFYPVCPGSDEYVLGSPRFGYMKMRLENGQTFNLETRGFSKDSPYIQSAKLNGKSYPFSYIRHEDIMNGGKLELTMGSTPNKEWGSDKDHRPHSSILAKPLCVVPAITAPKRTFEKSLKVTISSPQERSVIFYTLDGSEPGGNSRPYDGPITLKKSTTVRAIARDPLGTYSKVVEGEFLQIEGGRSISLETEYANQYAAEGNVALIDQLRGGEEFRTGGWQGYEGVDLAATVDLGKAQDVNAVGLSCLQDIKSWIWYPTEVQFSGSVDGETFTEIATVKNDFPDDEYGSFTQVFSARVKAKKVRYIKVVAKNYGTCPKWHLGAGGTAWLFADEIVIE